MNGKPSVAVYTLGCKLNQAESEQIVQQFIRAGYYLSTCESADICILNTCTVTHIADRKARHMIRLIRKRNPDALIVATGCYAQRTKKELLNAGANIVAGNEQKDKLINLVGEKIHIRKMDIISGRAIEQRNTLYDTTRVRSFIKIQDGCQHFCSYCIVPFVRNKEYCVPAEEIITNVKYKVIAGYNEVVLTGTEIGRYKDGEINLKMLIYRILKETAIERLHLSSLQPQEISEDLLSLWADSRLCRHFHLALQSGSDKILKLMRREYNTKKYIEAVELIKKYVPDVAITSDIIVGFPGENDEDFKDCYQFCADVNFAAIHVFPYSPRPETLADSMTEQVDDKTRRLRSLRMLELAKETKAGFQQNFIAKIMDVLFEKEVVPGSRIFSGLTRNYIRVFVKSDNDIANSILFVKLVKLYKNGLWGEIVS